MHKFLLTVLLVASCTAAFAQDLKDVQEKISKGKYEEAKEIIDKFLADPANQATPNAWYYKGKVYKELARGDSAGSLGYEAGRIAFDAFKKYQDMDKKNAMMVVDQNVELFQLFDIFYNQGVELYNESQYDAAFNKMRTALELEDYISKKGFSYMQFSFPALDTSLLNLTASAAYLSKKMDLAVPYWEKLAAARIKGKDFKDIYGLLVSYYSRKNDQPKAVKFLSAGKELYPGEDEYWISLEFDLTNPLNDTLKRFSRYEQLLQKYPNSYPLAMDYAIEQFNYTYAKDKKPSDYISRQQKLTASLERAIGIQSTAIANFVMAQHLYYQVYDLEDAQRAIKTAAAADLAKRKDLAARVDQKYEEFYPYAMKTYELYAAENELKAQDKANLRKILGQLVDYFEKKKQADKVAFYKEKLNTIN
jgi:hypothetical protein